MMKKSRESGFTMLEVVIASILLLGVLAITGALLWTSSNQTAAGQVQMSMDQMGREAVTQMEKELRQSLLAYVWFNQATAPSPGTNLKQLFSAQGIAGYPVPSPLTYSSTGTVIAGVPVSDITFLIPDPLLYNDTNPSSIKTSGIGAAYTYQIRYYWNVTPGAVAGDQTLPGQGVLVKEETHINPSTGLPVAGDFRSSRICSNLQPLPNGTPGGPFGFQVYYNAANPKLFQICLTMEKYDPRNRDKTFVKQICSNVELRN
jgi:type II secretory pathway pseudopilin PulG